MIYYILLVTIILFLRQNVLSVGNTSKKHIKEQKYSHVIWAIIVLMAALRSTKVGTDTMGYLIDYSDMPFYDFDGIVEQYKGYIGYYYASKIFSFADMPVQVWFGFVMAFYSYSMMMFINKYSADKLFSILVFVTIGLFIFSMAGLKQVMSMSFMMLAFLQFVKKQYWVAAILGFGAYLCHSAGLIFIAAFPLYLIREKKYFMPLIVATVAFIYLYGELFMSSMVDVLNDEHFEGYLVKDNSYSYVTLVFYVSIITMAFLGYKDYHNAKPDEANLVMAFSVIACGMQILASISPNMFRLAYLYSPFMMILLPNACYYSKRNKRILMQIVIICSIVFFFLFTNRNTPYSFFWQF